MHDNGIEDIITKLYNMIQDARAMPFGADKCVVERDRVLDLLDEISNQLPGELKQSKTIVDSKQELIANAKKEAEGIIRSAQQQAKVMISKESVVQEAQRQADEMIKNAQAKIKELKQVTNDYVDEALKRTEDAINGALNDVRESRDRLHKMSGGDQRKASSPIIENV